MKILLNDIIQYSDAPDELKSPMLSETSNISDITIVFDRVRQIDSVGIGNTDGTILNLTAPGVSPIAITITENGLYYLGRTISVSEITINIDASYIGRIGAGLAVNIPTSIAKEPGFNSTSEPRTTLSGQVIPGLGGYNYKTISLDSRYKIGQLAMNELQEGYKYIGMGYPFFIDLSDESYKLPFTKFYAAERNQRQMSFEGGVRKYLYSRRWEFEEKF